MRKIIFIRHAQSQPIPDQPQETWPLTAEAEASCHQLAEQLRSYQLSEIITSTQHKAVNTGGFVAQALGISSRTAAGFQEQDRTGIPFASSREAFVEQVKQLFAQPDQAIFGRETGRAAAERFAEAVNREMAQTTGNIGIVTHGRVLTLYLWLALGQQDPITFWQSLKMPDSISVELKDDCL